VAQVVEDGRVRDVPHVGIAPPHGEELYRLATVSDTHIGLDTFGFWPTVRDPRPSAVPPADRCLRAAVSESVAWGAQHLVAKGDITQTGAVAEAVVAARLLASGGVPVEAVVGNHETTSRSEELGSVFESAGIVLTQGGVRALDVPGARIVVFDSTVPNRHIGSYLQHVDDVCDAVADVDTPVLLFAHHHPQPLPVPHHWPPGVPSTEAKRFLARVARANQRVLMSTGHTHRHRRHEYGPITVTEVGSPQHYPGTWAGYVIHDGGIRQVVRRVASADALAWTEATARSVLRIWKRWSPGHIHDRCFSISW